MNLTIASIVALLAAVASADKYYTYKPEEKRGDVTKESADEHAKDVSPDDLATNGVGEYAKSGTIHTYLPAFASWSESSNRRHVLRNTTKNNVDALLKFATQSAGEDVAADAFKNKHLKEFISSLNGEDVAACEHEACLYVLAQGLYHHPSACGDALQALNGHQVGALTAMLKELAKADGKALSAALSRFPDKVFAKYSHVIIAALGDTFDSLTANVVKSLVQNPRACKVLTHERVTAMLKDPKKAELLSAACFANVQDPGAVELGGGKTNSLSADFLSKYNGVVSEALLKALKAAHVAKYAADFKTTDRPGRALEISNIGKEAMPGLTQAVVIGHMNSGNDLKLDKAPAGAISADMFKTLEVPEDSVTALGHIASTTFQFLPKAVFQHIIDAYPSVCAHLVAKGNDDNNKDLFKGISINNPRCFWYMNGAAQAQAYVTATSLHADCLRRVTAADVNAYKYKDSKGASPTGAAVFQLKKHANAEELIGGLGADPDGENPCEAFKDLRFFKNNKILAENISAACFQAVPRDWSKVDAKLVSELPSHLKLLSMSPSVLRKQPDTFWTEMKPEDLKTLVRGGALCPAMDAAIVGKLPAAAMSSMTGRCYNAMSVAAHNSLSGSQIAAFPDDVFATVPASTIASSTIAHMKKEHIAHACSKVADEHNNNFGAVLKADHVTAFSASQISGLTDEQWRRVEADAFAGVSTIDKLRAVAASAMVYWTQSQVKAIPAAVIVALSVEQAKEVGSKAVGEDSPVGYLASQEMEADVLKELNERLPEDQRAGAGLGVWVWVLIVVAVIAVIGGAAGAFYYFRS